MTFGARLAKAMDRLGPLCVGIDPHPQLLEQWGLEDTPEGLASFGQTVVSASTNTAVAVKPNAAFFERHGSRGVAALENVVGRARDAGLLVIMDAKRGDIGSTMEGYAEAFLSPGSPLESDALTVSPYLGFGSLAPAVDLAMEQDKGLFVLALTSNPEGASVQHAVGTGGQSVAGAVTQAASQLNMGMDPMGSVGLVVGATTGSAVSDLGIDLNGLNGPILAPGVGAQGASEAEVAQNFGNASSLVLVSQSRGILKMGPSEHQLRDAIQTASNAAQNALRA